MGDAMAKAQILHEVLWGVANLHLDSLVEEAAQAHEAVRR